MGLKPQKILLLSLKKMIHESEGFLYWMQHLHLTFLFTFRAKRGDHAELTSFLCNKAHLSVCEWVCVCACMYMCAWGHVGHDEWRVCGQWPLLDAPEKLSPLAPSPKSPWLRRTGTGELTCKLLHPCWSPSAGLQNQRVKRRLNQIKFRRFLLKLASGHCQKLN